MELVVEYFLDDVLKTLKSDISKKITDEDENLSFFVEVDNRGLILRIYPKKELTFKDIYINYDLKIKDDEKIFFNGYQSSTYSYEDGVDTLDQGLSKNIFKKNLSSKKVYGDYNFSTYKNIKGYNHSWSYLYIRDDKKYRFFGSLNEKFAFTKFIYQKDRGLTFCLDINSYKTKYSFVALNLCFIEGSEEEVFDKYFALLNVKPKNNKICAYVSNANNVKKEVLYLKKNNKEINTFIVDKLDKNIVDKLHYEGYKVGVSLSPFCVGSDSDIYKKHEDWFLLDENKKPLKCYSEEKDLFALDIYNKDFRFYLKELFEEYNKLNIDLFIFEYLYSACIFSRSDRPRGTIMSDGLKLLKEYAKKKIIVTRDVPLASCFGVVDACFVSPRISFENDEKFYLRALYKEESSYKRAVQNIISRRQLNKRAFYNMGDLLIINKDDDKKDKKEKLISFNSMFDNSFCISGDLKNLSKSLISNLD